MTDSTEVKVDPEITNKPVYSRRTTDFFRDAKELGEEERKFLELKEKLVNGIDVDSGELKIAHLTGVDDEKTQVTKMELLSLALDSQVLQMAQTAAEYIPDFGSRNPNIPENRIIEEQKIELLKKAMDHKIDYVGIIAAAKLCPQFNSGDSDLVLKCKKIVWEYGINNANWNVRLRLINDLVFRVEDAMVITEHKIELLDMAKNSEYEDVKKIAKTKIVPNREHKTAADI